MDTTQYYNQLNPYFDPQRAVIAQQRAALEPQMQAQISALEQAKINAYRDIGTTARARGMQFSGFSPEQEARYTGATYLPALANVKAQYAAGMTALDKALADIGLAQGTQALNIYQTEKTRAQEQEQWQREMDWKTREAELNRRATSAGGGGGGSTRTGAVKATMQQRGDRGFDFTDANGNAISAARYAELTGQGIGTVLYAMGQAGDSYAQQLYNQLANDPFFGKGDEDYDNRVKELYSAIFWGT